MILDVQFKIKNNPYYQEYIRNHSHWYKVLNRNPNLFREFESEVKDFYGLKPIHRLSKTISNLEFVSALLSTLK